MLPDNPHCLIRLRIMGVQSFQEAVRKTNKVEESFCLHFDRGTVSPGNCPMAAGIVCACSWQGLEYEYRGILIADRLGCHEQTLELGHEERRTRARPGPDLGD
jgi:hypothetical protein